MPRPPRHKATFSELACEAWSGSLHLDVPPGTVPRIVKVNEGGRSFSMLSLSQGLITEVTRALCIGRMYRLRAIEAEEAQLEMETRRSDMCATIEALQLRVERAKARVVSTDDLTTKQARSLEDLLKQVYQCQNAEGRISREAQELEARQEKNLEEWKTAWLSVDKILDKVWIDAGLLQDYEDDSNDNHEYNDDDDHDNDIDSDDDSDDDSDHDHDNDDDADDGSGQKGVTDAAVQGRHGSPAATAGTDLYPPHTPDQTGRDDRYSNQPSQQDLAETSVRQIRPSNGLDMSELIAFARMHTALNAKFEERKLRVESYKNAEEAAYDVWDKYICNFKSEFDKWECQQDLNARDQDSLRDRFRRHVFVPRAQELGLVFNKNTRVRRAVENEGRARRSRSFTSEEMILYENAVRVREFAEHQERIETWRGAEPSFSGNVIESTEWPAASELGFLNQSDASITFDESTSIRMTQDCWKHLEQAGSQAAENGVVDSDILLIRKWKELMGGDVRNTQEKGPSERNDREVNPDQAHYATQRTLPEPPTTSNSKRIEAASDDAYARKFQKRSYDDNTASRSSQVSQTTGLDNSLKRKQANGADGNVPKLRSSSYKNDNAAIQPPSPASATSSRKRRQTVDDDGSARKVRKCRHQDDSTSQSAAEASETSRRKRQREPDTDSNISKVSQHEHGDFVMSRISRDHTLNIQSLAPKDAQDTETSSTSGFFRKKRRELPWNKKQTGVLVRDQNPSAEDIFGAFVRKKKNATDS